jgi:chromosome segregation ATPase
VNDKKFRSSLFGGFNRDDVVKYIEKASEKTAEYRAESVKYHELVLANQKLQDKFNALQKEFGDLSAEADGLRDELRGKQAEIEGLQARLEPAEAAAAEFEATKDRLAEMEIAAAKRAAEIEREAKEQADAVAEKCSRSLDKLKAEYISASEDAESTAAHLLSEAERISRRMTTLGAMLADSADAFSELDFRR